MRKNLIAGIVFPSFFCIIFFIMIDNEPIRDRPMFSRLLVVGVGLLGGSVALAARRSNVALETVGMDRSPENLRSALALGAIDCAADDFRQALANTPNTDLPTLIVAAVPSGKIAETVENAFRAASNGAAGMVILTDVGSVKSEIFRELDRRIPANEWPPNIVFCGSHPIAGSQLSGPTAARADLFDGALTVLSPHFPTGGEAPRPSFRRASAERTLERFWERLGSRTVWLDAAEHDRILAVTSHLPHLLSASLAALISDAERPFGGTGFADMTRLAAGNPEIWADIFDMNRESVLQALERLEEILSHAASVLRSGDRENVRNLLEEARKRDALGS